ncbi:MAG: tetratricopeptide repeat protein [Thermoplasmata archaeon]
MRLCELRLSCDPRDPDALFAKAAVLARLGRYGEALRCLDAVSVEERDYPGVRRFRARILREMEGPKAQVWLGRAENSD